MKRTRRPSDRIPTFTVDLTAFNRFLQKRNDARVAEVFGPSAPTPPATPPAAPPLTVSVTLDGDDHPFGTSSGVTPRPRAARQATCDECGKPYSTTDEWPVLCPRCAQHDAEQLRAARPRFEPGKNDYSEWRRRRGRA
jgi:hypothetical protein